MHKIVNGKVVQLTREEITQIQAKEAEWEFHRAERERDRVRSTRADKYPAIGDQLDALYKFLDAKAGVPADSDLGEILARWKRVKDENPLP